MRSAWRATSCPNLTVQSAVLDGFRNVFRTEVWGSGQICNGPGHLQNAIISASTEIQFFHGHP